MYSRFPMNTTLCSAEKVREEVSFICNCCGCCCEAMIAAKKYGLQQPIYTTYFLPDVQDEACIGYGKCTRACPVNALNMETVRINDCEQLVAKLDEQLCLGCGVCVRNCPKQCIKLKTRGQRLLTPINSTHRIVCAAIEKGQLANLVFDTPAFATHRAWHVVHRHLAAAAAPARAGIPANEVEVFGAIDCRETVNLTHCWNQYIHSIIFLHMGE